MRHDLPDVYDDRPLRGPPRRVWPWLVLFVVVAAGAVWYLHEQRPAPPTPTLPPLRVVHDRPGGKVGEAEAALLLRRHFAPRVADRCLATIMNGASGPVYRFTVLDTCDRTRLGQWKVDVTTGIVSKK